MTARRILALDTATVTGWAVGPTYPAHGVHNFGPGKIDRAALWLVFQYWLSDMIKLYKPDVLAYERPFVRGPGSLKLMGLAVETEKAAYLNDIFVLGVSPATVKAHAKVKPRDGKAGMVDAARAKGWHVGTADEADALWLLDYAAGQLAGVAA